MALTLTTEERAMLDGTHDQAPAVAMRIVTGLARVLGAKQLIPVALPHVDAHRLASLTAAREFGHA